MKILNINNLFDGNSSDLLYHYTKREIAIEKILISNTLKFNSPSNTNDPLEFEDFHFEFQQSITNTLLNVQYEINEIVKNKYKICCFSIDKDNSSIFSKGFFRPRMWSQYADNHKGLCLVFRKEQFYNNLMYNVKSTEVPIGTNVEIVHGLIQYDNDLKKLHEILNLNLKGNSKNFAMNYIKKYIAQLLFTKLEDYRDESEYRFAIYSNHFKSKNEIYINLSNTLEGIILGAKYPKEYIINVFEYSKKTGIPIFGIDWENGKPSIDTKKTRPLNSEKYEESLF